MKVDGGAGSEDREKAGSWLSGSDWGGGGGGGWPQTSGDSSESLFGGFLTSTEERTKNEEGCGWWADGELDWMQRAEVTSGIGDWSGVERAGPSDPSPGAGHGTWQGGGWGRLGGVKAQSKKRRENPPSSKKNPGGDLVQSLFRRRQKMLLIELLEHSKRVVGWKLTKMWEFRSNPCLEKPSSGRVYIRNEFSQLIEIQNIRCALCGEKWFENERWVLKGCVK